MWGELFSARAVYGVANLTTGELLRATQRLAKDDDAWDTFFNVAYRCAGPRPPPPATCHLPATPRRPRPTHTRARVPSGRTAAGVVPCHVEADDVGGSTSMAQCLETEYTAQACHRPPLQH